MSIWPSRKSRFDRHLRVHLANPSDAGVIMKGSVVFSYLCDGAGCDTHLIGKETFLCHVEFHSPILRWVDTITEIWTSDSSNGLFHQVNCSERNSPRCLGYRLWAIKPAQSFAQSVTLYYASVDCTIEGVGEMVACLHESFALAEASLFNMVIIAFLLHTHSYS